MALLVDASVWLAALDVDDRHHSDARRILERSADGAVVLAALDLTLYEIANVAVVSWGPRQPRRVSSVLRGSLVPTLCNESTRRSPARPPR
jgi:predicted nucleic acid-binding protein